MANKNVLNATYTNQYGTEFHVKVIDNVDSWIMIGCGIWLFKKQIKKTKLIGKIDFVNPGCK